MEVVVASTSYIKCPKKYTNFTVTVLDENQEKCPEAGHCKKKDEIILSD
jgi:hypothetical protein